MFIDGHMPILSTVCLTCYKSHSVILKKNQPITCSTDRDLKELVDTFGLQATVITRIGNAQDIICGNKYIVE